jgi:hypothetical protein
MHNVGVVVAVVDLLLEIHRAGVLVDKVEAMHKRISQP